MIFIKWIIAVTMEIESVKSGAIIRIEGQPKFANTFGIAEPNSALDLMAQDSVLGHQILISGQELFVNGSRDVSKHSLPVHGLKLNQRTRP